MADRIIISFDDEIIPEENNKKVVPENADININANNPVAENDTKILTPELSEEIRLSEINLSYCANPSLSGFTDTKLKYPEGTESGFNKNYSLELEDEFFSSILINNRFIILTSRTSCAYFIDRFNPESKIIINIDGYNFEKTGCVIKNDIYLNSLTGIYLLKSGIKPDKEDIKKIYTPPEGNYIWSNLNILRENILFLIYDGVEKANLILMDRFNGNKIFEFPFSTFKYLSGSILVASDKFFVFADNFILIFEKTGNDGIKVLQFDLSFGINPETRFIALKNKLYINDSAGNVFYFDLINKETVLHNSGIKTPYLNSLMGFGNVIFTGHLGGWKACDTNGMEVFSHTDIDENKIEALNSNILIVSKSSKIVFHNLNRFQEAESFAISGIKSENSGIISALLNFNEIFILTEGGILESYSNKRLNINI
jgi:hypothetical protein